MNKSHIFLPHIFVISLFLVFIAMPAMPVDDLRFNHITVVDGLLHNNATSIAQDSIGFIWIATQRGLNRYDGYKLDQYVNAKDIYSAVYSNRIRKIIINKNFIWLSTYVGLQCFDISRKKYIDFDEEKYMGLANRQAIQSIFIDSKQRLWIATEGKLECALITINNDEVLLKEVEFNENNYLNIQQNDIPEVTELANGIIILKIKDNLFELQSTTSNNQKLQSRALNSQFVDIRKINATGNDLWLFSHNKAIGVRYINGHIQQFDEIKYPTCRVVEVAFSSNFIWICTSQGLIKIDKLTGTNRVQLLKHSVIDRYSIASDHQSGIFIDNQSNLWVSTWGGGVSCANIRKQKFYLVQSLPISENKYLPNEFVFSIHEDNKGDIYVGTKFGGISKYNIESQTFDYTLSLRDELNINSVVPSIESDENWIYAVVTSDGSSIYRFHKLNKKVELIKSYKPYTIFSFGFDKHQQLWVGVVGFGLSCLKIDNGKVLSEKIFTTQSDPILNLSSNVVNFIFNDKEKNEVLVSTANGLNRLMLNESGEVTSIAYYIANKNNPHSLSSNYVWPIDKENDSTYWVGTLGSGLNRLIIGDRVSGTAAYKAERFGTNEGAPSNDIESLLVDKFGNVWCGGLYLSRFNYKTKRFNTYYEEDGLQSYLFGTGTSCKARNGMLFFGGLKGMNYFMPDTIVDKNEHQIVFIRLSLNGTPIDVGDMIHRKVILTKDLPYLTQLKLPYPSNNFKIDFSSLTFSQVKKIQYRYKMEGFDKDWIYTNGMNAFATYSKLPYKKYKFIVEVGIDNEWDKGENSIFIDFLPPWWQSIWAYVAYFILIIFITVIASRYSLKWINMKHRIALQDERDKQKEQLLEMKMNFFTNISHEFKTPLTLINAAISEIECQIAALLENKYFQVIKRSNTKLLRLISELMDFQRSDAMLINLSITKIDVRKFMEDIFEEFLPLSKKSNIDMKMTLPPIETYAWVDEECLTKIVSNVISNSLRYTDSGGSIEIKIKLSIGKIDNNKTKFENKLVVSQDDCSGDHLIISIADTGVGISAESLPMIFERFHTVNSKTSKHLGSGIGLALVKSLVKLHKGCLVVSSERFVGTEFIFSIPIKSDYKTNSQIETNNNFDRRLYFSDYNVQDFDEKIALEQNNDDDSKRTLLLVDDNQEILMILSEHFKDEFNILMASDGEEGLEICNKKLPDVIISDVMMPRMDGLELCNRIKSQLNTCYIPVILLTARGTTEQQIEGLDEGADAYIPKPFHLGLLHSTINNLLKKADYNNQMLKLKDANNDENIVTRDLAIDNDNQKMIEKLTRIIELNLHDSSYTVNDLCLEVGVSRSSLYVLIKTITNETLGYFIREIRLQTAAKLLRSTSHNISEIAYMVGIDNPSIFTRAFKKRFGMPPSEYVKKNQI